MWRHFLAAGLAVILGIACSAASDDDGYYSGQTGSLLPCQVVGGARVPSGDVAGVAQTDGCPITASGDLVITDADGTQIPITLEPLSGDRYLIRTDEALTPGTYQVKLHDETVELVVEDPAPLPAELGAVTSVVTDCDAAYVTLQLTDAARAYAPLIALSLSIDGGPPVPWVDFGALEASADGIVELAIDRCSGSCWSTGEHQLQISAEIAGEPMALPPVSTRFEETCSLEQEPTCTLRARAAAAGGPYRRLELLAWMLAAGGVALWRRRPRGHESR